MNNIDRLNVTLNPRLSKGELPWVRFAAGNGWSIQDANVKGCHLPDLAEAVADYNRAIARQLEGLNVASVEPQTVSVMKLPGWGDAVRDELAARYADKAPEASHKGQRGPGKTLGALGGILPLLAMAAAMGALDDDLEESPALDGPPSDAMRDLLMQSKILHAGPCGHAFLAVPRSLGEHWTEQLLNHLKTDSVLAVRSMLEGAGLMK